MGAAQQVTVLSHRVWQRRFAGARDVLGRTIHLNGRPFTVVGLASEGFMGNTIMDTDLWLPLAEVRDIDVADLVLAAIGIYGITAYNVTRSTREIGVRVALGAAAGISCASSSPRR